MTSATKPAQRPTPEPRVDPNVADIPWVREGIIAGLVGASVVALLFAFVDAGAGRPLWTPYALGSALFQGRFPDPGMATDYALVVGYTAVHGAVFTAVALVGAFAVLTGRRRGGVLSGRRFLGLVAGLFMGTELAFVAFDALLAPQAIVTLGSSAVALANLLAAFAMAGVVRSRSARIPLEP